MHEAHEHDHARQRRGDDDVVPHVALTSIIFVDDVIAHAALPAHEDVVARGRRARNANLGGEGIVLADLDVHPRVAMQILRHAQFAITMEIYTKVSSEATRAALKKLGESLDR